MTLPSSPMPPAALPRIYAWFSAMMLDDMALMQDLLMHGLPVDVSHPLRHTTALMEATRLGRTAMVEWLLAHGAAPALLSGFPKGTPLHCALRCKQWDIAEILVNACDAPGVIDGYGRTPLHAACMDMLDQKETLLAMNIINLLVGKGCPLDGLDNEGITALHHTVLNDNAILTELLLVHGANPNIQTPDTLAGALMIAAVEKNMPIASLLLTHGANPYLHNKDGITPMMLLPTMDRLLSEHHASGALADGFSAVIAPSSDRLN